MIGWSQRVRRRLSAPWLGRAASWAPSSKASLSASAAPPTTTAVAPNAVAPWSRLHLKAHHAWTVCATRHWRVGRCWLRSITRQPPPSGARRRWRQQTWPGRRNLLQEWAPRTASSAAPPFLQHSMGMLLAQQFLALLALECTALGTQRRLRRWPPRWLWVGWRIIHKPSCLPLTAADSAAAVATTPCCATSRSRSSSTLRVVRCVVSSALKSSAAREVDPPASSAAAKAPSKSIEKNVDGVHVDFI